MSQGLNKSSTPYINIRSQLDSGFKQAKKNKKVQLMNFNNDFTDVKKKLSK